MGLPRLLVENFYNPVQFDDHTISANEQATGNEAYHVGDGRRGQLSFWTPTTENQNAWIEVNNGEARAADMLVIDRGHNLEGETVDLQTSSDGTTWSDVFSVTFPSSETTDGDLSRANGVYTEEGAWMKSFTSTSAQYWRVFIDAMGAGTKPEIRGLYLGTSFEPSFSFAQPFTWGKRRLQADQVTSGAGWRGQTSVAERREANYRLKLKTESEYDTARYHIEDLYLSGEPMWIIVDQLKAERSWLSRISPGRTGFEVSNDWGFQQVEFPAVEHQPEKT